MCFHRKCQYLTKKPSKTPQNTQSNSSLPTPQTNNTNTEVLENCLCLWSPPHGLSGTTDAVAQVPCPLMTPSGWALCYISHKHRSLSCWWTALCLKKIVTGGELGHTGMSERAFWLLDLFILLKVMHFHGNKSIWGNSISQKSHLQ